MIKLSIMTFLLTSKACACDVMLKHRREMISIATGWGISCQSPFYFAENKINLKIFTDVALYLKRRLYSVFVLLPMK